MSVEADLVGSNHGLTERYEMGFHSQLYNISDLDLPSSSIDHDALDERNNLGTDLGIVPI